MVLEFAVEQKECNPSSEVEDSVDDETNLVAGECFEQTVCLETSLIIGDKIITSPKVLTIYCDIGLSCFYVSFSFGIAKVPDTVCLV